MYTILPVAVCAGTVKMPVSFHVPRSWKILEQKQTDSRTYFLYEIESSSGGATNRVPSNALIQWYKAPVGFGFTNFDNVVFDRVKNATLVVSGADEKTWKTYLFASTEKGQQLIILYRIGIQSGIVAEAMISFPAVPAENDGPAKVLTIEESSVTAESMAGVLCSPARFGGLVNSFNDFCASLKIHGKNNFTARVKLIDPPQAH
jgi:hypothetical protein